MKPTLAIINRFALVMKPRPALIEWVNGVFPDDQVQQQDLEGHDNQDLFLIPEFPSLDDAEEWLQQNYLPFLEYILGNWCDDTASWPKELSWEVFSSLVDFSLESMVVDSVDEEYDEE